MNINSSAFPENFFVYEYKVKNIVVSVKIKNNIHKKL